MNTPNPVDLRPGSLTPGSIINEQYQVVKHLGEGAMGWVYLASDLTLDRYVALKILKPDLAEELSGNALFMREARLLSRMSHPNIVTIHAFATFGESSHFIVMEYLRGETLAEYLERNGPLNPDECAHVMTQIAQAVSEAHERGIIHRDLKPGNIQLAPLGADPLFVKVLDFGLAKGMNVDGTTGEHYVGEVAGSMVGTPAYISPEQALGEVVDHRTDIYALGVLAIQLLTGQLPFVRRTAMQYILAHINDVPQMPSELASERGFLSDGPVDQTLAKALSKAPEDRHSSILEFLDDLVDAFHASGLKTSLARPSITQRKQRSRTPEKTVDPMLETMLDLRTKSHATVPKGRALALLFFELEQAIVPTSEDEDMDSSECLAVVVAKIRQAVTAHRGYIVGPFDDRQIALFGVSGEEQTVERAITAALSIRSSLLALKDDPTMPQNLELRFRIGVDNGTVMLGKLKDIGELIHGETLFRARSLARRATSGQIHISRETYRIIRGLFITEPFDDDGPSSSWLVQGKKNVVFGAIDGGIHGVKLDLMGREPQMTTLRKCLSSVTSRKEPHACLLHGPGGVGKSRLVWEMISQLEEEPEDYFLEAGRCTSGGHHTPYEPFIQALRTRARLEEDDTKEQIRAKTQHYIRRYLAQDATQLDDTEKAFEKLLMALFGVGEEDDLETSLVSDVAEVHGAEARRAELFGQIAEIYRQLASRHPLIMFIDDFQWASGPTHALVSALYSKLQGYPVLFVIVTHEEDFENTEHVLARELPGLFTLEIPPLSETDAQRLVRHALRRLVEIPPPLIRAILELSQGFPFIIEETIHDLIDDQVIRVEDSKWRLNSAQSNRLKLPKSVEQLLSGRFKRLPPSLRRCLEVAAVTGKRFWPDQLKELAAQDYTSGCLAEFERRGFIHARREVIVNGAHDYGFLQLAMQESVYRSVPKARRVLLHGAVAEWLVRNVRGQGSHLDDTIGHHFQLAEKYEKALDFRLRAARRARDIHAVDEAIEHLEACLELIDKVPAKRMGAAQRIKLKGDFVTNLVHLLTLSGNLDRALSIADSALTEHSSEDPTHRPWLAKLAIRRGWALMYSGRYTDALGSFRDAHQALDGHDLPVLVLQARTGEAAMIAKQGDAEGGATIVRQEIEKHLGNNKSIQGRLGDLSVAYRTLGNCETWQGRYDEARKAYEEAHRLAEHANAPELLIDALNGLAAVFYYQNKIVDAEKRWRNALSIAQRWDLVQPRVILLNNLGELAQSRGNHREAIALLERAEALGHYLNSDEALADAYRIHAEALLDLDNPEQAETHARQALESAERVSSPHFLGPAHRTLARSLYALGDNTETKEVRTHLESAIEAFELAGMTGEIATTQGLLEQFFGAEN